MIQIRWQAMTLPTIPLTSGPLCA